MGHGETREPFVWPPRATDEPPADNSSDAGSAVVSKTGGVVQSVSPHETRSERRGGGSITGWRLFERACLGGALPSLSVGWEPESPEAACWRCAGTIGVGEADEKGCAACRGRSLAWSRAVRLGAYRGTLRDGIIGFKYQADRETGIRLGRMLGDRVARLLLVGRFGSATEGIGDITGSGCGGAFPSIADEDGLIPCERVAVVPVPTTYRRRRTNGGIDHSLVLANGVAASLGVRASRLLRRRHGPRRAAQSVRARAKQVEGVFFPRVNMIPAGVRVVVLVDDVRTTGATATACARAVGQLFERGDSVGVGRASGRGRRGSAAPRPVFVLATAGVSDARRESVGEESAFLEREAGW